MYNRVYGVVIMKDPERLLIYNLIYAELTDDGRDELFGKRSGMDNAVFSKSYAGYEFPEVWFELPLIGDPWYDLHVATSKSAVDEKKEIDEEIFNPGLFHWFIRQNRVRQLIMSHDLSKGIFNAPAAQLLVSDKDPAIGCAFLEEAGNHFAAGSYRSFVGRIPQRWFPCYLGTFPERNDVNLRVECIPDRSMQKSYASDKKVLRDDLERAGLVISDEMLSFISYMAEQPFPIEFQFNVNADGIPAPILGVSLRFMLPTPKTAHLAFLEDNDNVISLMNKLCDAGLCDDRWRLLPGCAFLKRLSAGEMSIEFGGYISFIKVRMTCDRLIDAKTYIVADVI